MTPHTLQASRATHARILADLDDLAAHIDRVRAKWQAEAPHLFLVGGRRIDDRAPGTDCSGVIKGNHDLISERGTSQPAATLPLPVYPTQHVVRDPT